MSEFSLNRLEELDIIFEDGDRSSRYPKANQFMVEGNHPFINTKNISDNQFTWNEVNFISDQKFSEIKKGRVESTDILMATRGSKLGKVAYYTEDIWGQPLINAQLLIIRCKDKRLYPKFLWYVLSSAEGQKQIESLKSGSAQPQLPVKDLKKFEVSYPAYERQCQIVNTLDSLNNKRNINRQTNQTLEQMTQAIFKSWFVDFEPTRAKIAAKLNGQDPERVAMAAISGKAIAELDQLSPDTQQQLRTTAALFPDKLVDSELGEIPEGWEVLGFKDIVEKYIDNRGKTPPISDSGIPLLEVKHLPEGSIKPNLDTTKFVDNETYRTWFRAHLQADDLMISTVGTIGRICMVPTGKPLAIAQNLLGIRFKRKKMSPYFMYYQMDNDRFRHDVDARLVITVQASIKRKDLETIDLLSPSIELQNIFESTVKPFVGMQQTDQQLVLSDIRDTLLPKLLSGELAMVEGA
ncbi:MAG: type I restriction enzyme S subunit [Oleiphilaceae bacterium]|jgi:type I restriction enzyme S subunit